MVNRQLWCILFSIDQLCGVSGSATSKWTYQNILSKTDSLLERQKDSSEFFKCRENQVNTWDICIVFVKKHIVMGMKDLRFLNTERFGQDEISQLHIANPSKVCPKLCTL